MSYRRAWMLVDVMNRCWQAPLVEATAGGGRGKGARLTVCGRDVLAGYRALEAALTAASREGAEALSARLLSQPRPSQHKDA
jgi:molybdate transport system regulatory protein